MLTRSVTATAPTITPSAESKVRAGLSTRLRQAAAKYIRLK
jgi:hypothetical protein